MYFHYSTLPNNWRLYVIITTTDTDSSYIIFDHKIKCFDHKKIRIYSQAPSTFCLT